MNAAAPFAPRRLLVALDASEASQAALEAALALARRFRAELRGLFVRDVAWEAVAAHPAVLHVDPLSGGALRAGPAAMQEAVHARRESLRRRLVALAGGESLRVTFHEAQGRVTAEVLAQAAACDLVCVGRTGWSGRGAGRLGSTARAVLTAGSACVLLVEAGQRPEPGQPVCVALVPGPAGRRALEAAAALAADDGGRLLLVVEAGGAETDLAGALARARALGLTVDVRAVAGLDGPTLARVAPAAEGSTLVLPAELLTDPDRAAALFGALRRPVLVVR